MEDCSDKRASEFVAPADKSVNIQLVERACELNENGRIFHPEFTHQMFGENESIFGYKEPRVDVLYGAATLTTYLGFSYAEKGSMHDLNGAKPDSVETIIGNKLAPGTELVRFAILSFYWVRLN
jgi:histone acetyltransferase 1